MTTELTGLEPVAWIMRNGTLIYQDNHILARSYDWKPLYSAATVEKLIAEMDELQTSFDAQCVSADTLFEQLATSQAREQQLREALGHYSNIGFGGIACEHHAREALAIQQDNTALRQWGAKLLREMADKKVSIPCIEMLYRKADELESKA